MRAGRSARARLPRSARPAPPRTMRDCSPPSKGKTPRRHGFSLRIFSKIAGISTISGRSAHQIAARFLEQAANGASGLSEEQLKILRALPRDHGPPGRGRGCAPRARGPCRARHRPRHRETALDIRNGFMEARGIDLSSLRFSAGFGRNLDYYTGFVFEIRNGSSPMPSRSSGWALRRLAAPARRLARGAGGRLLDLARSCLGPGARRDAKLGRGGGAVSPLVVAVPSKGRLQERADAFFSRARRLASARQAGFAIIAAVSKASRTSRILFLSASEITTQLASGGAHLGRRRAPISCMRPCQKRRASSRSCSARLLAKPMSSSPCRAPGSMCARWPISTMSRRLCAPGPANACVSRPNM